MEDTLQHAKTRISGVTPQQMRAIALLMEGTSYQRISDVTGIPIETIKNWFRKGTRVRGVYEDYCVYVMQQIGEDALHRLRTGMGDAVDCILEAVRSPETPFNVKLRAAVYLIDKVAPLLEKAASLDLMLRMENPGRGGAEWAALEEEMLSPEKEGWKDSTP